MTALNDIPSLPKPYGFFWHPHKTWSDLFISLLAHLAFPIAKVLEPCKPSKDCEKTSLELGKMRSMMVARDQPQVKSACARWAAGAKEEILETHLEIPRRSNILREWNIMDYDPEDDDPTRVKMMLRYPVSILKKENVAHDYDRSTTTGCKVRPSADFNLAKDIPPDVPIIVWFHGGGCIIGQSDDDSHGKFLDSIFAAHKIHRPKGDVRYGEKHVVSEYSDGDINSLTNVSSLCCIVASRRL